jgi:hypothetical protein
MTTAEFQKLLSSKAAHRRHLASLPIAEKLRLLDQMRSRELTLRAASLKKA